MTVSPSRWQEQVAPPSRTHNSSSSVCCAGELELPVRPGLPRSRCALPIASCLAIGETVMLLRLSPHPC